MTPDQDLIARLGEILATHGYGPEYTIAVCDAYQDGQLITLADHNLAVQAALDSVTTLHTVVSNIRAATVGYKPMLSDLPEALVAWRDDAVAKAVEAERARIIAGLREEADLCPCDEDAAVIADCADLIEADFSYDDCEKLKIAREAAAIRSRGVAG